MQVMEEDEDIAFLYHLIDGYAESSLACHIASLAGLPDELLKRAQQVSGHYLRHKSIVTSFFLN